MEKTKRIIIEKTIKCPWCNKFVNVQHTKNILSEPIKGEYEENIEATKSEQTQL